MGDLDVTESVNAAGLPTSLTTLCTEMYYWELSELHDKGHLPVNWRKEIAEMFPHI